MIETSWTNIAVSSNFEYLLTSKIVNLMYILFVNMMRCILTFEAQKGFDNTKNNVDNTLLEILSSSVCAPLSWTKTFSKWSSVTPQLFSHLSCTKTNTLSVERSLDFHEVMDGMRTRPRFLTILSKKREFHRCKESPILFLPRQLFQN